MDFKKCEQQIVTLMKELRKEILDCCGTDWDVCNKCRWNKETSNGISICKNNTELYPTTILREVVCKNDYDTIEQIMYSLYKEMSKDCDVNEDDCSKCQWNRVSKNGQTLCDLHNKIMAHIIVEKMKERRNDE